MQERRHCELKFRDSVRLIGIAKGCLELPEGPLKNRGQASMYGIHTIGIGKELTPGCADVSTLIETMHRYASQTT